MFATDRDELLILTVLYQREIVLFVPIGKPPRRPHRWLGPDVSGERENTDVATKQGSCFLECGTPEKRDFFSPVQSVLFSMLETIIAL